MSNKLKAFVEAMAYCPCCTGVYECEEECTIEEDSTAHGAGSGAAERYELMVRAREALTDTP